MQTSAVFILICLLGNILNVWMEFGAWHMVSPLRDYIDGITSLQGTTAYTVILFFSSTMIGFKLAMMYHLRGSLYMGMADHFVNNTIVNLVHVTAKTGTDEMMFFRIAVAQTVSFLIVLGIYLSKKRKSIMNAKGVEG